MATKKNLEKEYRRWLVSDDTELYQVYKSGCSTKKHRAMKDCRQKCEEMGGTNLKIVAHNGWMFTVGWTYIDKETGKKMFKYETAKNSYIWKYPKERRLIKMLQDYVNGYVDAYEAKDKKKMRQIEGTLFRLGMDKMTLIMLASDILKERRTDSGEQK